MDNFLLIIVCILAGILMQSARLLPPDAHKGINTWLLYVALPAVSFRYLPRIEWSLSMIFPIASTVLVWAGSWLFVRLYAPYKNYGQRSKSALELYSGYSNTSFIGIPLIIAYFGEQSISIAIICDQTLFVLLSTAGIVTAVKGDRQAGGQIEAKQIVKRLITFPPFIGCVSALVLSRFFDFAPVEPFFGKLTATVAPLALFSIGTQLQFKGWDKQRSPLSMALLYKLILAPALVMLVALLAGVKGDVARISIFEASMPTLMTASVIAEQFHLNSRLINLIIGASIGVSFLTTYGWYLVLQHSFG